MSPSSPSFTCLPFLPSSLVIEAASRNLSSSAASSFFLISSLNFCPASCKPFSSSSACFSRSSTSSLLPFTLATSASNCCVSFSLAASASSAACFRSNTFFSLASVSLSLPAIASTSQVNLAIAPSLSFTSSRKPFISSSTVARSCSIALNLSCMQTSSAFASTFTFLTRAAVSSFAICPSSRILRMLSFITSTVRSISLPFFSLTLFSSLNCTVSPSACFLLLSSSSNRTSIAFSDPAIS